MYTISQFAELLKLSIDTLRYYEKEGLIKPQRNPQNQRVYSTADVAWMEFILRLKQTGMPISGIKKYALLREQGPETIEERLFLLYEQQQVLCDKKAEIDAHVSFLAQKITTYQKMLTEK